MPLLDFIAEPARGPRFLEEGLGKRRRLGQFVHAHREFVGIDQIVQEAFRFAVRRQTHQVALLAGPQVLVHKVIQQPDRHAGERNLLNHLNIAV